MREVTLWRRLSAEFIGSAFLAMVVIGSGIAAQQLSPGNTGLQLLENAAATGTGLFAIILMFGAVSGAHLNPIVSFVDAAFGGLRWRHAAAYLPAQVGGCVLGAIVANVMFSRAALELSTKHRASPAHFLSEVIATLGLMLVIFALARSGRSHSTPAAVGAYIGAAYFFTSSTSFANPAITVGRSLSNTFAGIAPSSVPEFCRGPDPRWAGCRGSDLGPLSVDDERAGQPGAAPPPENHAPPAEPRVRPKGSSPVSEGRPAVLFLCVHNAGRSQMAAALLTARAGGRIGVHSAGSAPGETLNPAVVTAMAELGLDISDEKPKKLTDEMALSADVIVTMGCGDECPAYPGKRYLDWELPDPAGKSLETVRLIRDDIAQRVGRLMTELLGDPDGAGPATNPR